MKKNLVIRVLNCPQSRATISTEVCYVIYRGMLCYLQRYVMLFLVCLGWVDVHPAIQDTLKITYHITWLGGYV